MPKRVAKTIGTAPCWQVGKVMHVVGWDTEGEPLILLVRPNPDRSLYVIDEQRGAEAKRMLLEMIKRVAFS